MSLTPHWAIDAAMKPDPREEKQPLWMQETLRTLRQALAEQRALAEDALRRTEPETAQILLDPYADHEGIGLPDRSVVRFRVPGQGYLDISIREGSVDVHAEHTLAVLPKVSNSVRLKSRRGDE